MLRMVEGTSLSEGISGSDSVSPSLTNEQRKALDPLHGRKRVSPTDRGEIFHTASQLPPSQKQQIMSPPAHKVLFKFNTAHKNTQIKVHKLLQDFQQVGYNFKWDII